MQPSRLDHIAVAVMPPQKARRIDLTAEQSEEQWRHGRQLRAVLKTMGWDLSSSEEDDNEQGRGGGEPITSEDNHGKASGKGSGKSNKAEASEPSARSLEEDSTTSSKTKAHNPGPQDSRQDSATGSQSGQQPPKPTGKLWTSHSQQ